MVRIRIRAIGKIKEAYLQEGIRDYSKRIMAFSQIEIVESPESSADYRLSGNQRAIINEGEKLCDSLPEDSYTIALDPAGKEITSNDLADIIHKCEVSGPYQITFIIGGPLGLSETCKKRADIIISLSRLVFPHQLVRLILFEQIYRAFTIIRGLPYHR
jgi:23S rRNA (pseudouridine1915-N3)-methyltransferase